MREYQRRLSVFEFVPGTGSIVSISVGIVDRMLLDPIVWCDCHILVVTLHSYGVDIKHFMIRLLKMFMVFTLTS